ncbi:MAG: hypothetical protein LBS31_06535 [Candidatus Adiutrix sp.]|jgi:hypothetical protein|nr:hypothetical protein [Candidatus Adiutrix sp.]
MTIEVITPLKDLEVVKAELNRGRRWLFFRAPEIVEVEIFYKPYYVVEAEYSLDRRPESAKCAVIVDAYSGIPIMIQGLLTTEPVRPGDERVLAPDFDQDLAREYARDTVLKCVYRRRLVFPRLEYSSVTLVYRKFFSFRRRGESRAFLTPADHYEIGEKAAAH